MYRIVVKEYNSAISSRLRLRLYVQLLRVQKKKFEKREQEKKKERIRFKDIQSILVQTVNANVHVGN